MTARSVIVVALGASLPLLPPAPSARAEQAAPVKMTTPGHIERACEAALAFARSHEDDAITLWDVSSSVIPAAGNGMWWHVADADRFRVVDAVGAHGPNTQLNIWKTPSNVLLVVAFFTSDSGDWAYFVDYCYRPDGTVARTSSTLNSFVAANPPNGVQRERTRYFDPKGKILASRATVSDLHTKKPLKLSLPGYDEPAYPKVEALPFLPLLRSLRAPR